MTETDAPKELSAAEQLKQHVREFGHASLIDAMIDSMGDAAKTVLDKIRGNKPAEKAAAATAPKEE